DSYRNKLLYYCNALVASCLGCNDEATHYKVSKIDEQKESGICNQFIMLSIAWFSSLTFLWATLYYYYEADSASGALLYILFAIEYGVATFSNALLVLSFGKTIMFKA
ncbi:MAG TPA: hypothetical protein VN958_13380, partial [Chitinophagaceae bacterium]|nr:hypothetical protein [Chitinophagaceae bacterium]